MGNSYRLKSAQVILPLRVCSRWSHIPHRLQRCFAKGYKKTVRANSTVSLHPFAEREGFEPPDAFTSTVFKTAVIDHSTTSPIQYQKERKDKYNFPTYQI